MTTGTAVNTLAQEYLGEAMFEHLNAPTQIKFSPKVFVARAGRTDTSATVIWHFASHGGALGQGQLYTQSNLTCQVEAGPALTIALLSADMSHDFCEHWQIGFAPFGLGLDPGFLHLYQGFGANEGLEVISWGPSAPSLLAKGKYVLNALEKFRRAGSITPEDYFRVVEVLNVSARRGFRPVVAFDETDNSLEIEARLDANNLLLLQVWTSGEAEGLIFNEADGFSAIDASSIAEVANWLTAFDHQRA